jgi:hypothetical protein
MHTKCWSDDMGEIRPKGIPRPDGSVILQCTYNVMLGRVRSAISTAEEQ